MTTTTKRLMAGLAAAATLFAGLSLATMPAMADETPTEADAYCTGNAVPTDDGHVCELGTAAATNDALNTKADLKVTSDGYLKNKTLVAVRLAKYTSAVLQNSNGEGEILSYALEADQMTDAVVGAIPAELTKADGTKVTIKDANGDPVNGAFDKNNPMQWVVSNLLDSQTSPYAGNLRDFLTKLGDAYFDKNATAPTSTLLTVKDDGTEATASLDEGIYVIFDTTEGTDKDHLASIPMMTGTKFANTHNLKGGFELGTIEYKPTLPTISKTITAGGNVAGDKKSNDAAIGTDITYQLDTKVPNWTGYNWYYFALDDTLSDGLTFNDHDFDAGDGFDNAPFKVTLTEKGKTTGTVLTPDKDYKAVQNGQNFKIYFAPTADVDSATAKDVKKSNLVATDATKQLFSRDAEIKVEYRATLNSNAVIGDPGNPNDVTLNYSNHPNRDEDFGQDTDKTKTYTGALSLHKVQKQKGQVEDLANAKFTVTDAQGNAVHFTQGTGDQNVFTVSTNTADPTEIKMPSAAVTFNGLDGEYKFTEIYSPLSGGNPHLSFTAKVEVTNTGKDAGTYKVTKVDDWNKLVELESGTNAFTVKVTNTSLLEMPKTGATWLCIFAAAVILLIGGGTLLLVKDRKSAKA